MTPPAPLTPPDSDISDFGFIPLDVVRFRNSDLVAFESAEAILAALMLWGVSWHSTPAGSLTDDDRSLAQAAGYGRAVKEWQRVREGALRGFIKCSDGRLYHPVVAEKVNEAWRAKLRRMWNTHCAAARKRNERRSDDEKEVTPSFEEWLVARDAPPMSQGQEPMSRVTEGNVACDLTRARDKGQGQGQGQGQGESKKTQSASPATPGVVRKREIDPFDVMKVADQLARRAGVPHSQPTQIAANLDTVRQWQADGIDLELVESEIDRFRLDKPDQRVTVLRFFDTGVRAKLAAAEAKARKGRDKPFKPTMATNPTAPLKSVDDDDDRIRKVRTILNGNATITPDKVAFAIGDDEGEPILVATCRSAFIKSNLDMEPIRHAARDVIGSGNVELRVQ